MAKDKQIKVIVIGAGNRGTTYAGIMAQTPEKFKVVGVAEPVVMRREAMAEKHGIPAENVYTTWEDILARPKFADVAVIATMDRMHYGPAMKAIELGYDILLEKPVSPSPEECVEIMKAAKEKGVKVMVCHVLRFTSSFRVIKDFIASGRLGRVMSVEHTEAVGNVHQSHSFVRGRWGNSSETSPMLLQKSCHDLDIIQWMLGKECSRIQSFGSLGFFNKDNAPEGSSEICHDRACPEYDTCPYNSDRIYLKETPRWFHHAVTVPTSSEEEEMAEFLKTKYARCVYKCDNNVVDHQTVNMEFEDGCTVVFSMNAFNRGGRKTTVYGTKGELVCNAEDPVATFYEFETKQTHEIPTNGKVVDTTIFGGHGGGDTGIIAMLYDYINDLVSPEEVSEIEVSTKNHMLVFAAEKARAEGTVVDVKKFTDDYMG